MELCLACLVTFQHGWCSPLHKAFRSNQNRSGLLEAEHSLPTTVGILPLLSKSGRMQIDWYTKVSRHSLSSVVLVFTNSASEKGKDSLLSKIDGRCGLSRNGLVGPHMWQTCSWIYMLFIVENRISGGASNVLIEETREYPFQIHESTT